MTANPPRSWWRWSYLWIALALAVGLYLLIRFLPGRPDKATIMVKAKEGVRKLVDEREQALTAHRATMQKARDELKQIETIKDDKARLQALADFANRKRTR